MKGRNMSKKRKLTPNLSELEQLRKECEDLRKEQYKEKYERFIAEKIYNQKRDLSSGIYAKTVSQYVSEGGSAWSIAPEKFWFRYNTCKNPICQDDGMDWFANKFYCNIDCEQTAEIECAKLRKS